MQSPAGVRTDEVPNPINFIAKRLAEFGSSGFGFFQRQLGSVRKDQGAVEGIAGEGIGRAGAILLLVSPLKLVCYLLDGV